MVVDRVVLAVEGLDLALVPVELAAELLLQLGLEQLQLLAHRGDHLLVQLLQPVPDQRDLLGLALELVLPALQPVQRLLDLPQQHLPGLLLGLAAAGEPLGVVGLVMGAAAADAVAEAVEAELPANVQAVQLAGRRSFPCALVALGLGGPDCVVGVGVLFAEHNVIIIRIKR